jgi:hypothetical protein
MAKSTIFLIRHAEKPVHTRGVGITQIGDRDDESLTVRGWQRAGGLAQMFSDSDDARLPRPDAIYASGDEKIRNRRGGRKGSRSHRPEETVLPLAKKNRPKISVKYLKGDEVPLVAALADRTGVTLVCWQHEAIPEIAGLILRSDAPGPKDRYDVVWRFARKKAGHKRKFTQVPQLLLHGDSPDPNAPAGPGAFGATLANRHDVGTRPLHHVSTDQPAVFRMSAASVCPCRERPQLE